MDNKDAKHLTGLPYMSIVSTDETTGGRLIYFAENPGLYGCMGQGGTPDEALADLADARLDYIEDLLEDGDPVPIPQEAVSQSWST